MDSKRLVGGVVGGLAGGILFGALMHMMDMMGMVAGLVGQDSVAVGWILHLGISVLFGVGYALTFGAASKTWGRAIVFGMVYGVFWWVAGALLLMPARMGMPLFSVGATQLQSLVGHLMYGLLLAAVFQVVAHPAAAQGEVQSRA